MSADSFKSTIWVHSLAEAGEFERDWGLVWRMFEVGSSGLRKSSVRVGGGEGATVKDSCYCIFSKCFII